MDPRNEAVLGYLDVERVAAPGTNTAWVIDRYSLLTHPDLCDRVGEITTKLVDPRTVDLPRAAGLQQLGSLVRRAVTSLVEA